MPHLALYLALLISRALKGMLMEDIYLISAIVGTAGVLGLFIWAVRTRWQRGAPARRQVTAQSQPSAEDAHLRERLETVNSLLSRVQAADTGQESLGTELAGEIRRYLGPGIVPHRRIPAQTGQMLNDIIYAERLLAQVQTAANDRGALPALMAEEVNCYLGERPRLES
jgi:hypothetical protein